MIDSMHILQVCKTLRKMSNNSSEFFMLVIKLSRQILDVCFQKIFNNYISLYIRHLITNLKFSLSLSLSLSLREELHSLEKIITLC